MRKTLFLWAAVAASLMGCAENLGCEANEVTLPPPYCGDGAVDSGEECDTNNFAGRTCADYKGKGATGTLQCDKCSIDASDCKSAVLDTCGNGELDPGEVCDGAAHGGRNCASLGQGYTGMLKCLEDCSGYDESGCEPPEPNPNCGNGRIDEGELCDGDLIREGVEYTCKSIFGPGSTGKLKCDERCLHFDKSDCTPPLTCGDGTAQINEKCDPAIDYGERLLCTTSYGAGSAGQRVCNEMCRWDNSGCRIPDACGNGRVDADEDCDPSAPQEYAKSCEDFFGPGSTGSVTCSALCRYESSGCSVSPACGNGQADNGTANRPNYNEVCDPGGDLKHRTCAHLGEGYSGTLQCLVNCTGFDFTGCEAPEQF